jgi:hypothetical protein
MKRPHSAVTRKFVGTTGDIKQDLSEKQLATIGALILAYNKLEDEIENMFSVVTGLKDQMLSEISSRITSIDIKLDIIKAGAKNFSADPKDQECLAELLGTGFKLLKRYRDAVAHCKLINASIGIGLLFEKQAKINEVLLSQPALDALYSHIVAMKFELQCATSMLIFSEIMNRDAADPERVSYEAGNTENSARFQRYLIRRQSLPPIPEFPSESEFEAAQIQWQQARQAALMGWHRSQDSPLQQRNNVLLDSSPPPPEEKN